MYLTVADRRQAVAELEEEGLSIQKTADVLGVHRDTVYEDRKAPAGNPIGQEAHAARNPTLALDDAASSALTAASLSGTSGTGLMSSVPDGLPTPDDANRNTP